MICLKLMKHQVLSSLKIFLISLQKVVIILWLKLGILIHLFSMIMQRSIYASLIKMKVPNSINLTIILVFLRMSSQVCIIFVCTCTCQVIIYTGYVLGSVFASDPNDQGNNAIIRYSLITDPSDQGFFSMNSTSVRDGLYMTFHIKLIIGCIKNISTIGSRRTRLSHFDCNCSRYGSR